MSFHNMFSWRNKKNINLIPALIWTYGAYHSSIVQTCASVQSEQEKCCSMYTVMILSIESGQPEKTMDQDKMLICGF